MSSYETLTALLRKALATERPANILNEDNERWEMALSAQGLLEAARLLGIQYDLVVTNVPYLGRGDQCERLKHYCQSHYEDGMADLATTFLLRLLELSKPLGEIGVVSPQAWLLQAKYQPVREYLLQHSRWDLFSRLGPGAFETINGQVVNVLLGLISNRKPSSEHKCAFIDGLSEKTAAGKAKAIRDQNLSAFVQINQLENPEKKPLLKSHHPFQHWRCMLFQLKGCLLEMASGSYKNSGKPAAERLGHFSKTPHKVTPCFLDCHT